MRAYREGLRRRLNKPLTAEEEKALETARGEARQMAEQLVKQHGAKRVILFGSVAQKRRLRRDSDIDLAVEGMPAENFYKIVGDLRTDNGRAVDLIRLETARESLRKLIMLEGVELSRDGI
ncbi:MAG: nucleotidyltransferase domain-containing protein [Chloroflexi bacterium]|nr:nucleotidyltransferase domain-containing protein [Chloroflexota bacterium]